MKQKALVIGIDDYLGSPLHCCMNDAEEIARLLKTNSDGSKNFDVLLKKNVHAKEELAKAIEQLFSKDDDIALLYFAGHGMSKNDGEYICTPDGSEQYPGVKLSSILEWANASKCRNKIIILDSCFSGGMGAIPLLGEHTLLSSGLTILSASRATETAQECGNHGVFTRLLIEALKGGAADLLGNITPGLIYAFIDKALGCWEQRPIFKTNVQEFVSLRKVESSISLQDLQALPSLFQESTDIFPLDSSFEFTNDPAVVHTYQQPYANKEHVKKFKQLQRLEAVGIVTPISEEHMYFAAMHSTGCKLTILGQYYWTLAKKDRF